MRLDKGSTITVVNITYYEAKCISFYNVFGLYDLRKT